MNRDGRLHFWKSFKIRFVAYRGWDQAERIWRTFKRT